MIQTAIWIPPSLCGCQIKMTADFTEGSVVDGITYRHPIDPIKAEKPCYVSNLEIVNVCSSHKDKTLSMLDTSVFFDDPLESNQMLVFLYKKYPHIPRPSLAQNRGYLKYPINNPTPAECLYTFLSLQKGLNHGFPCGCYSFMTVDEKGKISHSQHPLYMVNKCIFHRNDNLEMEQAANDFNEMTKIDSDIKNSQEIDEFQAKVELAFQKITTKKQAVME